MFYIKTNRVNVRLGPKSGFGKLIYLIIAVCTAMVGYHIHGSIFWSIVDFIFWPFVIIKWLICKQLTLAIIKATFAFFFS